MIAAVPFCSSLAVLLALLDPGGAAEKGLTRAQLARRARAATALVEVKGRGGTGSAFCIHPRGLFVTSARVALGDVTTVFMPGKNIWKEKQPASPVSLPGGDVTLVLGAGRKAEKAHPAAVIRLDRDHDLALLRVQGVKDFPALRLGSDAGLGELMDVWAFGHAAGPAGAFCADEASIQSLPRKDGRLARIQLNKPLDPGHAGGPVLDRHGNVVGVVATGPPGGGAGFAVPAGTLARFLAPPEVQFDQPHLDPVAISRPVRFTARLTPLLASSAPCTVDLIVKPPGGPERKYPMRADGGRYHVTTLPISRPPGPVTLRVVARFENGMLKATATDQVFKVGGRELQLSEVASLRPGAVPGVALHDGQTVEGALAGLDRVPLRLGGQTLPLDLTRAREVTLTPAGVTDHVQYTLVVRQGDREVFRQRQSVTGPGLKYLLLPIDQVASAVSTKSLFTGNAGERLIFPTWGKQQVLGMPFDVVDPRGDSVKNAIVLYGPAGSPAREMPTAVRLKCGSPAKAIHLLSGVAGWGGGNPAPCLIVRLHYRDGGSEDHVLINGVHFCDFCAYQNDRPFEVPGSRLAIELLPANGTRVQVRYLAIRPKNPGKVIEEIEFVKDPAGGNTAPVIMAVTVEKPRPPGA